jgi:predicted nucleotidyltransferase
VDLIIDRLDENIAMDEVIVFGSYAYGKPNTDSDIDLCVIVSDKETNKRVLTRKIRKILSPIIEDYPLDILVYDKDEFYDRAICDTTLEYKISREGVKVYG